MNWENNNFYCYHDADKAPEKKKEHCVDIKELLKDKVLIVEGQPKPEKFIIHQEKSGKV